MGRSFSPSPSGSRTQRSAGSSGVRATSCARSSAARWACMSLAPAPRAARSASASASTRCQAALWTSPSAARPALVACHGAPGVGGAVTRRPTTWTRGPAASIAAKRSRSAPRVLSHRSPREIRPALPSLSCRPRVCTSSMARRSSAASASAGGSAVVATWFRPRFSAALTAARRPLVAARLRRSASTSCQGRTLRGGSSSTSGATCFGRNTWTGSARKRLSSRGAPNNDFRTYLLCCRPKHRQMQTLPMIPMALAAATMYGIRGPTHFAKPVSEAGGVVLGR
mmetsp:Transcript_78511/g.233977  ORF Transcript_78511/g.233977 Transcript_78511/m.233977 type:complete len:283 (+) Transcript_78511:429-1277(+)